MFLQIGVILASVSSKDFTLVVMSPSTAQYFLIELRRNRDIEEKLDTVIGYYAFVN